MWAGCGPLRGTLARATLSESFPELWLLGLGALFIGVVMAFPNGLAGLYAEQVQPRLADLWFRMRGNARPAAARPSADPDLEAAE